MLVSFLPYSSSLNMEAICSSKHELTFNRLHGIISQKKELFITTTMRTSNATLYIKSLSFLNIGESHSKSVMNFLVLGSLHVATADINNF
jgi:hypothetical protein